MEALLKDLLIFIIVVVGAMVIGKLSGHLWISAVVIIGFLLYVIIRKGYKSSAQNTSKLPTDTYMKYVGGHCPDYFNYLGEDGDNDVCQNTYGINVGDSAKCYSDPGKKIINFPKYDTYPMKKKSDAKKKRCQWIQDCGLTTGQFASWSGMDC